MISKRIVSPANSLVLVGTLLLSSFASLLSPAPLGSANLTSVKDTLQSSRLSWGARVEADGTSEGTSRVQIQSAPAAPLNSTTTNALRSQDTILINSNSYTVIGIIDADEFTVSPVVQSGDADDGDPIYLESRPRHVISFSTATAVADGFFQILLPADTTTPNDGNIDDGGFDFNDIDWPSTPLTVTASDIGNYDFITGVSTPAGQTGCTAPANYHCFEVHYSGNGGVGQALAITIGETSGSNTPIAPGEGGSHTEGTADTYTFIVKNFAAGANPSSDAAVDQTSGKIALVESVRVTATVDPTINFTIAGVASAQTRCGFSTDVTTTATRVPFGNLTVLDSFYDAAQDLTVSTNASGGYVVTSSENDEMSLGGAGVTVIADTPGDNSTATESVTDEWNTGTTNGFGYSIDNDDAAAAAFEYTSTTGNCTGTFCAKQFANIAGSDSPQSIFSSSTVASSENAAVCYRISVGASQAAGDYENQVTYTATGTF